MIKKKLGMSSTEIVFTYNVSNILNIMRIQNDKELA